MGKLNEIQQAALDWMNKDLEVLGKPKMTEKEYLEYKKKLQAEFDKIDKKNSQEEQQAALEKPEVPEKKKRVEPEIPIAKKVYEWSSKVDTEEQEEPDYLWTEEANKLLYRLQNLKGIRVMIVGNQGIGKTALKEQLELELSTGKNYVISVKWGKDVNRQILQQHDMFFDAHYLDEVWESFLNTYKDSSEPSLFDPEVRVRHTAINMCKALNIRDGSEEASLIYHAITDADSKDSLRPMLPAFKRALGPAKMNEINEDLMLWCVSGAKAILIDFPDYDKNSFTQWRKDLEEAQCWIEHMLAGSLDEGYDQKVNVVLTTQKELYDKRPHYFFNKCIATELRPIPSKKLTEYYKNKFGSYAPFKDDALLLVASLSRGIFRRFRKYIFFCVEEIQASGTKQLITVEDIKKTISKDMLYNEMERELANVFADRVAKKKAVDLLYDLQEKGSMSQTEISKKYFDGQGMNASRFLERLEAYGYIVRELAGDRHKKLIKPV